MKKINLLAVLMLFIHTAHAQYTAIPDQNFEQALIDLGYDNVIDGQVLTANIVNVEFLDLDDLGLQDLTGIEDFNSLIYLRVEGNQLTNINISQNTFLQFLGIDDNPISSVDISYNTNLEGLSANFTNLTSLNTSNNPNLYFLYLWECNISSLDLSNNTLLDDLDVDGNNLSQLDLSNLPNLQSLYFSENPNLSFINLKNGNSVGIETLYGLEIANNACIQVDNAQAATNASSFPYNNWEVDPSTIFSENCSLSNDTFELAQIRFYPNPATDKITILNTTLTSYQIYDTKGSLLVNNLQFTGNEIDVESLRPGVYFLKVNNDKMQIKNIRFMKK